jgi:hypothetical protein
MDITIRGIERSLSEFEDLDWVGVFIFLETERMIWSLSVELARRFPHS